jgi:hypothetical protein
MRKKSGISYPQNAMRHCFASYHIGKHKDAPKTAVLLGHPNPSLLYRTYLELVTSEDAEKYWNVVPESVRLAREASKQQQRKQADDAERESAESLSNVGEAVLAACRT